MSTDGQTSDPRASPRRRHRGGRRCRRPRGDARRRARRGRRRRSRLDGRDLRLRIPIGPGLQLGRVARDGRRRRRPPGDRGPRPGRIRSRRPPSTPRSRRSIARRPRPDGSGFIGAYLPLVVGSGGVDVVARLDRLRLAGAARARRDRARDADRRWPRWRPSPSTGRASASTAAERSEWFERMAHTDPLTGLANERTVGRVLELELARAGRQGSEVSFAMFDVDDFRATNRGGRPRGRRRRPAPGRRGPRRVGPAGRHGRADRWRRVRAGGARLGRRDGRAAGPRRDRGTARGRRPADHGLGRRGALPGRRRPTRPA